MAGYDGIRLETMSGLKEAMILDDVWTGKTDRAERKRIQNRLNQRAYKKRKAAELQSHKETTRPTKASTAVQPQRQRGSPAENTHAVEVPVTSLSGVPLPNLPAGRDTPEILFPLSTDHLLTLVQYNVVRAMILNHKILDIVGNFDMTCHAMYHAIKLEIPLPDVPPTFQFTTLQKTVPHDSFIDTIPCSQMRDNLIMASQNANFNGSELCRDLVGGWCEGRNDVELKGMIAWSHTWSPCGWEVTEGFLLKWGFLLKGCERMLASTNKWRALRGEDALVW